MRVFSHATEEQEKVQTAIKNLLPLELTENIQFKKTVLTGHYGNSIIILEVKLAQRQLLNLIIEKFVLDLNSIDKQTLSEEIREHIQKRDLYLRFDKQSAYLGKIKLSTNDPIHVKLHFRNQMSQQIVDICKQKGLIL